MIDASTARKLAGVGDEEVAQEEIDKIAPYIKGAAEKKQRMCYFTDKFWSRGGYDMDPTWKLAVKKLEEYGYTVKFRYEERQFVDMGTEVHW